MHACKHRCIQHTQGFCFHLLAWWRCVCRSPFCTQSPQSPSSPSQLPGPRWGRRQKIYPLLSNDVFDCHLKPINLFTLFPQVGVRLGAVGAPEVELSENPNSPPYSRLSRLDCPG